jgi:NADP-dependent 3-hydroxy acid dehydrogenase YdfG
MEKKFALVTGATKGIGKAVVFDLAGKGYSVAFCSRSEEDGFEMVGYLKSSFPDLSFYFRKCDVRVKSDIDGFVEKMKIEFSDHLDILVNNAGIYLPGNVIEEDEHQLPILIETNLYSAYYFTRSIIDGMIERKSGYIYNMCSVASLKAYPNGGSYSISKYALHGFSAVLREELKPYNIKVTSIFPGATWSDSWKGVNLPEERLMKPEDIASLITSTLLLSPAANVEDIVIRPQLGDL